jgi:preprotein translocase subunit YajC
MDCFFWSTLPLLAQAGDGAPGGGSNWILSVLTLWLPIGFLFYFLMIRPQRQEQMKRKAMIEALKKNDRVVTIGGIYATVTNVHREADEITLKIDEANNTKIRVAFSAVARVLEQSDFPDSTRK